jgi:hypothetical protein
MDDRTISEYGALDGMSIDMLNLYTRRKHSLVQLCPLQIPHVLGLNPDSHGF